MRAPRVPATMLAAPVMLVALAFAGCEGDPGPMGPQGPAGQDGQDAAGAIVAFASVDAWTDPQNPAVSAGGPSNVTITVTYQSTGHHTVVVDGVFSGQQPTLFVSGSDANTPTPSTQVTGDLVVWTSSRIEFDVSIWSSQTNTPVDDVFSFVLLV